MLCIAIVIAAIGGLVWLIAGLFIRNLNPAIPPAYFGLLPIVLAGFVYLILAKLSYKYVLRSGNLTSYGIKGRHEVSLADLKYITRVLVAPPEKYSQQLYGIRFADSASRHIVFEVSGFSKPERQKIYKPLWEAIEKSEIALTPEIVDLWDE
jgi:hypothetical protein